MSAPNPVPPGSATSPGNNNTQRSPTVKDNSKPAATTGSAVKNNTKPATTIAAQFVVIPDDNNSDEDDQDSIFEGKVIAHRDYDAKDRILMEANGTVHTYGGDGHCVWSSPTLDNLETVSVLENGDDTWASIPEEQQTTKSYDKRKIGKDNLWMAKGRQSNEEIDAHHQEVTDAWKQHLLKIQAEKESAKITAQQTVPDVQEDAQPVKEGGEIGESSSEEDDDESEEESEEESEDEGKKKASGAKQTSETEKGDAKSGVKKKTVDFKKYSDDKVRKIARQRTEDTVKDNELKAQIFVHIDEFISGRRSTSDQGDKFLPFSANNFVRRVKDSALKAYGLWQSDQPYQNFLPTLAQVHAIRMCSEDLALNATIGGALADIGRPDLLMPIRGYPISHVMNTQSAIDVHGQTANHSGADESVRLEAKFDRLITQLNTTMAQVAADVAQLKKGSGGVNPNIGEAIDSKIADFSTALKPALKSIKKDVKETQEEAKLAKDKATDAWDTARGCDDHVNELARKRDFSSINNKIGRIERDIVDLQNGVQKVENNQMNAQTGKTAAKATVQSSAPTPQKGAPVTVIDDDSPVRSTKPQPMNRGKANRKRTADASPERDVQSNTAVDHLQAGRHKRVQREANAIPPFVPRHLLAANKPKVSVKKSDPYNFDDL